MTFNDETLMAYADGELDAITRAAVEAAMAADPNVAQRIAQHRALRSQLNNAFDPVLAEPVPERLLAIKRATETPNRGAKVVPLRSASAVRWSWPQLSAVAASLVLGLLVGPWLLRAPAPVVTRDGVLLAGGPLAHALSEQLSGAPAADAPVQIGVSFRTHTGDYCRTFVLQGKSALAGLACHEQGNWHLQALAAIVSPAESGGYREAASTLPPAVASTLDALIAGEPLDVRAETMARERGWNR